MKHQINTIREALERAQNGLKWYRDAYPEADSQADDEMNAQIEQAHSALDHLERMAGEPVKNAIEALMQSHNHLMFAEACKGVTVLDPKSLRETIEAIEAVIPALKTTAAPPAQQPQAEAVRWRPDVCPITGKPFFMWIDHPKHGDVPTYGGPYDSYTIPVRHEDGSFCCERYDHDNGWWVTDEVHDVGVQIVSDQAYVSDEAHQQAEAVPSDKQLEVLIYEHTKLNPNQADDRELIGYIINAIRAAMRQGGVA